MNRIARIAFAGIILASLSLQTGCIGFRALQSENDELRVRIVQLEVKNKKYQKDFYELLELKDTQKTANRLEVSRLESDLKRSLNERTAREKKLDDQVRKLNFELQNQMNSQAETKQAYQEKMEGLKNELTAKSTALINSKNQLTEIKKTTADSTKIIEEANKKIAELELKAGEVEKVRAEMQKKVDSANAALAEQKKLTGDSKKDVTFLQDQVKNLQEDLKARDESIAQRNKEIKAVQDDLKTEKVALTEMQKKNLKLQEQLSGKGVITNAEANRLKAEKKVLEERLTVLDKKLKQAIADGKKSVAEKDTSLAAVEKKLRKAYAGDIIHISRDVRGVVLRIGSDDMFKSGTVIVSPDIEAKLERLAKSLAEFSAHPLSVEGHTDNQPVIRMPFPDNLSLSSQRAVNVTRFLIERGELPQNDIRSIGYGESKFIAGNSTLADRKKNRRVEIVIGPLSRN